jgi:hypothetical protein
MQTISELFKEYLTRRSPQYLVKVDIAGTEYYNDQIVEFDISQGVTGGEEFQIGAAISSQLILRLKNVVVPVNARIVPYVALQLPDSQNGADVAWQDADVTWQDADFPWQGNVTERLPMGEFYVDTREIVQGNILVLTCADRLRFSDIPYVSSLTYPTTMAAVWTEVCSRAGFTTGSSVQIDPAYQIQAGPAGYSCRQMLAYIASVHSSCVYVDRDGLIQWRTFGAADEPVAAFSKADYVTVVQTNPQKTYTRLVVVYNTDDGLTYERGSGDENHTLTLENPFVTPAMMDDLYAQLSGYTYTPATMDVRGYPQFDVGDRIRYGTPAAELTWATADVAWQDADITWDGYEGSQPGGSTLLLHLVYSFKGGLKMRFDAPSKSEQQSEYKVEGTLSGQINRLNATAVREGRSYFGVTVTRTNGFIVEREDHASKVIFNSDELTWQVGGENRLYYDALSNKLKFKGDIEMEGGSINWSSVGAPAITDISGLSGKLTYIGPTGIYSGTIGTDQLIAGSALIGSALIDSLKANKIDVSTGKISTAQIDTLTVGTNVQIGTAQDAAGVTSIIGGTVTTSFVEALNISVSSAQISDSLVVGTNVGLGTAKDAAGVTTIVNGTVTTSFVNALNIQAATVQSGWVYAGTVNANQINVGTLTGFTIQTASSGARLALSGTDFSQYNSSGAQTLRLSAAYSNPQIQWTDLGNASAKGNIYAFNGMWITTDDFPLNLDAGTSLIKIGSDIEFNGGISGIDISDVTGLSSSLSGISSSLNSKVGILSVQTIGIQWFNNYLEVYVNGAFKGYIPISPTP